MTTSERIISLLMNSLEPLCDRAIAETLNVPIPSVRRERGMLERRGLVRTVIVSHTPVKHSEIAAVSI